MEPVPGAGGRGDLRPPAAAPEHGSPGAAGPAAAIRLTAADVAGFSTVSSGLGRLALRRGFVVVVAGGVVLALLGHLAAAAIDVTLGGGRADAGPVSRIDRS